MWVRVVFAFALALGCAGKSRSSSDDEPSAGESSVGGSGGSAGAAVGGSSSGGTSADQDCNDERRALRNFINDNKSCSDSADCATHFVGCGITEAECTGAVFTNEDYDRVELRAVRDGFSACLLTHEDTMGCGLCEIAPLPPVCSDGMCVGPFVCALESSALWDFKSRNDACEVDDDCVSELIGCDLSEDDCTGAVYFSAEHDREELALLRDEYHACTGGCTACRRAVTPAACVLGHCTKRPLR